MSAHAQEGSFAFHRTDERKTRLKRLCDCGHWIGTEPYRYQVWKLHGAPRIDQRLDCPSARRVEAVSAADVRCVGDVTDEHRGWYLRVTDPSRPSGYDYFTLGKGFGSGVRRWTYEGVEMVGLTDDQRSPGIVGTEHMHRANAPCELLRQVKRSRRRS